MTAAESWFSNLETVAHQLPLATYSLVSYRTLNCFLVADPDVAAGSCVLTHERTPVDIERTLTSQQSLRLPIDLGQVFVQQHANLPVSFPHHPVLHSTD